MGLPKSCVRFSDPFLIVLFCLSIYLFTYGKDLDRLDLTLIFTFAVTFLMHGLDFATAPWRKTPRPRTPWKAVLKNSLVRVFGVTCCLWLVLIFWWLFTEYKRPFFSPLFNALPVGLPLIFALTVLTILYTEWRLGPAEKNPGKEFLALCTGKFKAVDWHVLRQELLAFGVKAFFLPLNFISLYQLLGNIELLQRNAFYSWGHFVYFTMTVTQAFMLAAIVPGYIFSARIFGTHFRKVDMTMFGWFFTLACYPPLITAVFQGWIDYHPPQANSAIPAWITAYQSIPVVFYVVGGMLILLEIIHYWGEACFNTRASNLSNRGIITNGPFRLTKHPIYLVKCIAWFLVWLHFQAGTPFTEMLRYHILWLCVCGVYIARSVAEEKLLSADPTYVAYAKWIDKHGMFAWAGRLIPPLSYEWRYARWKKELQLKDA